MKQIHILLKRECQAYFSAPIAYTVLCIFLVLCGYFFYRGLAYFSLLSLQASHDASLQGALNVNELVLRPLFSNMTIILVFIAPLLSMRAFSEEKKSGTMEFLFSYPVSETEIVIAKFCGTILILMLALSLSALLPGILFIVGTPEFGPILSGYVGLMLLGVAFLSIGLFFSSLTENQIIAAVTSFGCLILFWTIGWSAAIIPGATGKLLSELSAYNHFRSFAMGVINIEDILFFINLSLLFFFWTVQSLRAKRWRG